MADWIELIHQNIKIECGGGQLDAETMDAEGIRINASSIEQRQIIKALDIFISAKSLGSGLKATNDSTETKFLSYSFPKGKKFYQQGKRGKLASVFI